MRKYIIQLMFILCLLPALNTVLAATNTSVFRGKINSMNLKAGKLVIDDSRFYLASRYTVKNNKDEVISAFSLKTGQIVEYTINDNGEITEVIIVR